MRMTWTAFPAALAAAALVAGCGTDDGDDRMAQAKSPAVEVKTFIFQPDPIEIEAGQAITWTNRDSAVHTVTSGTRDAPDERFDEQLAESGGTAKQTFDRPGTYKYFCSIHSGPGMEGEVTVR